MSSSMKYKMVPVSALALDDLPDNVSVRRQDAWIVLCLGDQDCAFPTRDPHTFLMTTNVTMLVQLQPRWCTCTERAATVADYDNEDPSLDALETLTMLASDLTVWNSQYATDVTNLGAEYYAPKLRQALRWTAPDFAFHNADNTGSAQMRRWVAAAIKDAAGVDIRSLWEGERRGEGKAAALLGHERPFPTTPGPDTSWVVLDSRGQAKAPRATSETEGMVAAVALMAATTVRLDDGGVACLVPHTVANLVGHAVVTFSAAPGDDDATVRLLAQVGSSCPDSATAADLVEAARIAHAA
jgi:hypothetical protein